MAKIHTEDPVLLVINAREASNDGIAILSATENIVLADEIPPQYLSLMKQINDD